LQENQYLEDQHNTRQGIMLIVVGLTVASFSGAIMKLLSEDLNAFQIAWFRFSGMGFVLFFYFLFRSGSKLQLPRRPVVQVIRGICMAGGTTTFVLGAKTVDYADAIAILYAYPFLLILIAVLFLGEKASGLLWIGVIAGFAGVLMVMQPKFNNFNQGHIYILICALIVAVQMALNRKLGTVSPPLQTAFWGSISASVALTFLLPINWQAIPSSSWWLIGVLIVSGIINQTMLVFAFSKANASTLAPFTYTELIAAVLLGFVIFGTLPTWLSWIGIILISVSGLIVARLHSISALPRRVPRI
jgi:drug/metabolite transporter (DMT)-like permease